MKNGRLASTVVFTDTDRGGIVHVANIKGGVGKSTVATNLAASLAKRGPTLLIDLDVQGSASVALGVDPERARGSSWELFRTRFAFGSSTHGVRHSEGMNARLLHAESLLVPWIVGRGEITSLAQKVSDGLELIPANAELFNTVRPYHLSNLLHNLNVCRSRYKYVILDTPSIWNGLTKALYRQSDLNLVPVTLNALSTKSLRDYLHSVKKLAERYRSIRIRIVKNEVYGNADSKIKGKTRTMYENRKFLERLCEQIVVRTSSGISLLPQTILFDLEIPESAMVRDAQDEGKAVGQLHQYSVVTKAFDELAQRVQYVFNSIGEETPRKSLWHSHAAGIRLATRLGSAALCFALLGSTVPVQEIVPPRPVAPQQLREAGNRVIEHRFKSGESIYRIAKHAICQFRAVVPSQGEINRYVMEVAETHNRTRQNNEPRISDINNIPQGTVVNFYPPSFIHNRHEKQLLPVYQFFCTLVDEPYPYVTGDWCERGTGGGQPHYGIDIASALGAKLRSPIDGTVVQREFSAAGRTIAIVNEGHVLFYAHMDKRFFKTGDKVRKGEVIGTVGMTGRTSGPHLHLGYGVRSLSQEGSVAFGKHQYRLTDPKLFFYREVFLNDMARGGE
jgi:cellulose biosynthesis protein BcsQ